MLQGCTGVEGDAAVVAGVVGFERTERELLGTPIERVRAEGIGHAGDLSLDPPRKCR
jgi:hypothetical protein